MPSGSTAQKDKFTYSLSSQKKAQNRIVFDNPERYELLPYTS
jgi:hypothetical protein